MPARQRYVDTVSTGGDGTTQAHSGSTAAYASSSAAEAAEQTADSDLTDDSTTTIDGIAYALIVDCAGGADTGHLSINGWTTDSTHQILWRGDPSAPGSDGKNDGDAFSTSFYYLHNSDGTNNSLDLLSDHITIDGLQFRYSHSTANRQGVRQSAANVCIIRNCKFQNNVDNNNQRCIFIAHDAPTLDILNNSFELARPASGTMSTWDAINFNASTTNTTNIINNSMCYTGGGTAGRGITLTSGFNGGTVVIKNNVIAGAVTELNDAKTSGTVTESYNASDTTLGGTGDVALSGTRSVDFTDYANGDFSPVSGGAMADAGNSTGAPTTDQNGVSWGTHDIGAFAFVSGGGGGFTKKVNSVTTYTKINGQTAASAISKVNGVAAELEELPLAA